MNRRENTTNFQGKEVDRGMTKQDRVKYSLEYIHRGLQPKVEYICPVESQKDQRFNDTKFDEVRLKAGEMNQGKVHIQNTHTFILLITDAQQDKPNISQCASDETKLSHGKNKGNQFQYLHHPRAKNVAF